MSSRLLFQLDAGFFQQGSYFGFPDKMAEHLGHKEPEFIFHLAPKPRQQGFAAVVDQAAETASAISYGNVSRKICSFIRQLRVFAVARRVAVYS